MQSTFLKEFAKSWILIDCTGLVLGRAASFIASRLMGKHNCQFSSNIDCGDMVIAINSDKIRSYNKKILYKHTGYIGSIKSISMSESIIKQSDVTLRNAVKCMLNKYRLIKNLKIYKDSEHKHIAQNPIFIDFASMNRKNIARIS